MLFRRPLIRTPPAVIGLLLLALWLGWVGAGFAALGRRPQAAWLTAWWRCSMTCRRATREQVLNQANAQILASLDASRTGLMPRPGAVP